MCSPDSKSYNYLHLWLVLRIAAKDARRYINSYCTAIFKEQTTLHYARQYTTVGCIPQMYMENVWFRDKYNILKSLERENWLPKIRCLVFGIWKCECNNCKDFTWLMCFLDVSAKPMSSSCCALAYFFPYCHRTPKDKPNLKNIIIL